jgi:hypothetical protein
MALIVSAVANAGIIPILTSGPTASGGNFIYTYELRLQQDERLDPAATAGVTCPSTTGLAQCNPAGTFQTIYDIDGFQSVNVTAANWFATIQFTGITPSSIKGNFDSPNLVNVTFFYTGPVVHSNSSVVPFDGFQIVSSINGTTQGNFSFQATKDAGSSAGNTDQGTGPVLVPGNSSTGQALPEPASMGLLGFGLIAMAAAKRYLSRS